MMSDAVLGSVDEVQVGTLLPRLTDPMLAHLSTNTSS